MIKRILKYLGLGLALALIVLASFLSYAHWQVRQFDAPMPEHDDITVALERGNGPIDIRVINTATQNIPGTGVFSYPSFVVRWSDGRLLLIDVGMTRDAALQFGRFLERLTSAEPIVAHGSVAEQLGTDAGDVRAVILTHLHDDHTEGLPSLCAEKQTITVFQTSSQATSSNFTTRKGFDLLRNQPCVRRELSGSSASLHSVPGFPGVAIYPAGGHTPGSTVIFVALDSKIWVFSGDIANDKSSLLSNVPKPFLYSLLLVPEDGSRLRELRVWLAKLDNDPGMTVVVSHDHDAIASGGLAAWQAPDQVNVR